MSDDAAAASMDAIIASIRDGLRQDGSILVAAAEPPPQDPAPPPPEAATTLEALVQRALEPVLKAWLDANLPEIVDRAARDEIARLIKS